ncbi:MAG: class I SAM-dependent methyltransferase [Thaumarchaeota archaeon]|nr:MAG: class I SAM-dependent methyltransferase [Nitrososphaerota archaeon]
MIEKIVTDLYCVNKSCKKIRLSLESFLELKDECIEGFLSCENCTSKYPIIQGVPVLMENFHEYARQRILSFGKWIVNSKSPQLKAFLRSEGVKIGNPTYNDRYEENSILYKSYLKDHYGYPSNDKLLSLLNKEIKPDHIYKMLASNSLNLNGIGLDIGCSIGSSTFELSKKLSYVFGIDLSFSFILEARKRMQNRKSRNMEFIVADATNLPFRSKFFQIVVALNVIDRMDFNKLILSINSCIKKYGKLILVDPYHFVDNNGKEEFDSVKIRNKLEKFGYKIKNKESYIPWIIKMNERSYLFYFVDFLEADKNY